VNWATQSQGTITLDATVDGDSTGGIYVVGYALSAEVNTANKHLETAILINGAVQAQGQNQMETAAPNLEQAVSGRALLDIPGGATVGLAIRTVDTGAPNLLVHHIELTVHRIVG
jgi:hypothetical protein